MASTHDDPDVAEALAWVQRRSAAMPPANRLAYLDALRGTVPEIEAALDVLRDRARDELLATTSLDDADLARLMHLLRAGTRILLLAAHRLRNDPSARDLPAAYVVVREWLNYAWGLEDGEIRDRTLTEILRPVTLAHVETYRP